MTDTELEETFKRFMPNGVPNGVPDRDHFQKELTTDFIALLLLRGNKSVDDVTRDFAKRYAGTLRWLGETRQDEMLQKAMEETGEDLSHWLD